MRLQIVDSNNRVEKESELIHRYKIDTIINLAKNFDYDCLIFIDSKQDTYFSAMQCEQISKEIFPGKYPEIDIKVLSLIRGYAGEIFDNQLCYLRFVNIK